MDTAKLPVRAPISHDYLNVKVDVLNATRVSLRAVLGHAVLCCAVLCCAVLCCAVCVLDSVSLSSKKSLPTLSAAAARRCEELELIVSNNCDGCYRGRSLG